MCETGNQRIKLGSVFGKFSKYDHGLSELCQVYLRNALSSICPFSPSPIPAPQYNPSTLALAIAKASPLTPLLWFLTLSSTLSSCRVIYSKQNWLRDCSHCNLRWFSSAQGNIFNMAPLAPRTSHSFFQLAISLSLTSFQFILSVLSSHVQREELWSSHLLFKPTSFWKPVGGFLYTYFLPINYITWGWEWRYWQGRAK